MKNSQSIRSLFALPGFVVGAGLKGLFGNRYARVIQLKRRKKQLCALTVGNGAGGAMTSKWVLPPSSVGEMTLRLYGALSYSQNSARDLRRALNGA